MVYFQRRVERAEAEPGIEQFWQMIVTGQKIAEAASDKCSRIAVYNIVGGGNTHLFQLGLRPVRNLALQTDTAVHDERKAAQFLLCHGCLSGKGAIARHEQSPAGGVFQGKVFIFHRVDRLQQNGEVQYSMIQPFYYICCIAGVKVEADVRMFHAQCSCCLQEPFERRPTDRDSAA